MRLNPRFLSRAYFQALGLACGALLISPLTAGAGEVPFATGVEVVDNFQRGRFVTGADMDGDGDQDILGVGQAEGEIAWFENTGDINSWTRRTIDDEIEFIANPLFATPVDLDQDGDLDVLAANLGDGTAMPVVTSKVVFYINQGDALSWSRIIITEALLLGEDAATAADIDQDGDLDVFVGAMTTDDFLWFENTNGNGTAWVDHVVDGSFNGTLTLESVDFDRDGDYDVVASGEFEDEVAWFENPGPDTVGTAMAWTRHVAGMFDGAKASCPADFDRDGDYDIGLVHDAGGGNPDRVMWLENTGDNDTFNSIEVKSGFNQAHGIFCTDMDADGDVDIYAVARSTGTVTWFENRLDQGMSWAEHNIDNTFVQGRSVWFADLTENGLGDAVATGDNSKILVYENQSTHRNASQQIEVVDASLPGARGVAVGDINADHQGDVVASGGGNINWWNRSDDGTWVQTSVTSTFAGAAGVTTADVDHDGDLDVVGSSQSGDTLAWFENTAGDGSAWLEKSIDLAFDGANVVAVGDMDQNGTLDVVAGAFEGEEFAWWSNDNGDGSAWTKTSIAGMRNGAISVQVVDLDRDGDLDVLGAAETDDDALFFRNGGDGSSWSIIVIDGNADGINGLRAGDIDGDGDLDAVAAVEVADTIVWWENTAGNGTAWSAAKVIDSFINNPIDVGLADFDADGDLDVVASQSKDGGKVTRYENTGNFAAPWPETDLTTVFDAAGALAVGDLDANGQPDVTAVASQDNTVAWFPNRGGQFGLATDNTAPVGLGNSVTDDVLRIEARHNGLVGERDLELTSFELLLEELPDDPLSPTEAESIIENLFVYLDDGNDVWEMGSDTLVATVSTLTPVDGVQPIDFTDGDPNVQLTQGTPRTYFVVLETTSDFDSAGVTFFQVSHLTESTSTAEDRMFDTPVSLEWAENVSSNLFEVNTGPTSADLVLASITDSPDPVDVNNQVTYTVTVTNNGPFPALNVRVAGSLPANSTLASSSGCLEDPMGAPTCTLGSLASGASESFTVTLDLEPAALGTVLVYQATVSSDTTEAAPGDETETQTTTVIGESDVAISTLAVPVTYADGFTQVYQLTVENLGASPASNAEVSNTLPAALTGTGWTCEGVNGGTCAASGSGNLSSEAVTLPPGAKVVFYAFGTVPPGTMTELTNSASVTASNDSAAANNSSITTTQRGDWIFLDGFESGNTSGWSAAVP